MFQSVNYEGLNSITFILGTAWFLEGYITLVYLP